MSKYKANIFVTSLFPELSFPPDEPVKEERSREHCFLLVRSLSDQLLKRSDFN